LLDDNDLVEEIHQHIRSIGKYMKAMDIIHFLGTPKMLERLHREKQSHSRQLNAGLSVIIQVVNLLMDTRGSMSGVIEIRHSCPHSRIWRRG
jgi:hypothetical protein